MQEFNLHIGGRTTSVVIGKRLFDRLEAYSRQKMIFLVDENVYAFHRKYFEGKDCIIVPPGEGQKTMAFAEEVLRKMVKLEADRTSFLVAVGGGLVTDLAGFVASVYMRGIGFGFISSTLLGQVDASIGGKNGVNLDGYKNMIGLFNHPDFVWCDLELLESLDQQELVSGFAEVIKYGAIKDHALFEFLENNYENVLKRNYEVLEKVITASAAIKTGIVERDATEQGERRLLNYGHTLGHAIEKLTGMMHGEAIAIGMVLAAWISSKMGFLAQSDALRLEQLIARTGLPVKTGLNMEDIYDTLLKDKKRSGNQIHFIMLRGIGDAFVHQMDLETLREILYDLY
ncbi:MAG: 3-dehydroquinate synthase [Bacteroidales bacterium]|nr:3-dehydroquinate synthase [Bacteroidales bacterium]